MTDILLSVHLNLAAITRCPEFELEQKEAAKLAEASARVASFYDVSIDPKYVAWAQLYGAIGSVYFTRFMAIKVRVAAERAERADAARRAHEEAAPDNVEILRPVGSDNAG